MDRYDSFDLFYNVMHWCTTIHPKTLDKHVSDAFYLAVKLGKHSAIVFECLFWACSSSAGARVVSRKVCLQVWQTMFFAASLTFVLLVGPLSELFAALRSRFCAALAPFPMIKLRY